jgi:hypothetical protein
MKAKMSDMNNQIARTSRRPIKYTLLGSRSYAFAEPQAGIGYAYVTNQMGAKLGGDPRDLALRGALRRSV